MTTVIEIGEFTSDAIGAGAGIYESFASEDA